MKTYGKFRYAPPHNGRPDPVFGVIAEPYVMDRAKRIFPGARQNQHGQLIIPATPDHARDLEWLVDRHPLEPFDAETIAQLSKLADVFRNKETAVDRIINGDACDISFTGPRQPALTPRDYQLAVPALLRVNGGFLLADGLGMGKTFAASLITCDEGALPCAVVVPQHIVGQWATKELPKYFPWARIHKIRSGTPYRVDQFRKKPIDPPHFLVFTYGMIQGWVEHLVNEEACRNLGIPGMIQTVIFDEADALRTGPKTANGGSFRYEWCDRLANGGPRYRIGLSVGPDSIVELVGGPFGAGWVGRIEDATNVVDPCVPIEPHGTHEIMRVGHLGIRSRGWTGEGFAWKDVKSFVRHPCDTDVTAIRTGHSNLILTAEHSVYRVGTRGLELSRADGIAVGDRLAIDTGSGWEEEPERLIDVTAIAETIPYAQVTVDLSGVSRHDLGVTSWQWQNFHREARYGTRLPAPIYRKHADILPPPTDVYVRGRSRRRIDPRIRLSDWAYMLGFYLGDGWIGGTRVSFAVENERVEHFLAELRAVPGADIEPSVQQKPRASVEVRFGHPIVAEIIRQATGGTGCREKSIPGEWITSWPEAARRELLRGLIDSDGHIAKRAGRRYYVTVSRPLAMSLLSLLRSLGIAGSVSIGHPAPGGESGGRPIVGRCARYTVNWSAFAEGGDHSGFRGHRRRFPWTQGRLYEAAVRGVDHAAARPAVVYDLEMDGHPSFVADGQLVHNTATPVHNYSDEMWNVGDLLQKGCLGTKDEFTRTWGKKTENPRALGAYLRDRGIMLRRIREDVGQELGQKPIRIEQPVETDSVKLRLLMEQGIVALATKVLDGTRQERFTSGGQLESTMRKATGIAKAPYVAAFTRMLLETEKKILLVGHHHEVQDIWLHELRDFLPVMYGGRQSPTQKEEAKSRFIEETGCRVMVMAIRSGAGLNGLQHVCNTVVFGEIDWTPPPHDQVIGRLDRDGQTVFPVMAHFMISDEGSDPIMADVLQVKRAIAHPIVDPDAELFRPNPEEEAKRTKLLAEAVLRKHGIDPANPPPVLPEPEGGKLISRETLRDRLQGGGA